MKKTIIVGITGQTGAGKTAVASFLKDIGINVIDADVVSREVLSKNKHIIKILKDEFGSDILNIDETVNRKLLAERAFSSKGKTEKLNEIMFPPIVLEIKKIIDDLKQKSTDIIILDAPALFESGSDKFCDIIVSVIALYDTRLKRIMKRDSIKMELAKKRISVQKPESFYRNNSDFILNGEEELEDLLKSSSQLISDIRKEINCEEK